MSYVGINVTLPGTKHYDTPQNIFIEDFVSIGKEGHFYATPESKIMIKKGTILAERCRIYTRNHNYNSEDLQNIPLDHRQIVADVVIGEGSVVSKSIPDYAVAVGNPVRIVKYRNSQRFERLKKEDAYAKRLLKKKEFIHKH